MGDTTQRVRQVPVRLPVEVVDAMAERAAVMGVSREQWIRRAIVHALEHAKTTGEPPVLRLPWSALL